MLPEVGNGSMYSRRQLVLYILKPSLEEDINRSPHIHLYQFQY
ncbi:hypothetical protein QUA35_07580 [Microcoleus sp. N9_B2]